MSAVGGVGLGLEQIADELVERWGRWDEATCRRRVGHLVLAWAEQRTDPAVSERLRHAHPDLAEVLRDQRSAPLAQAYARYLRGEEPFAEGVLLEQVLGGLNERLSDVRWAEHGVDPWYPRMLRRLDPEWGRRALFVTDSGVWLCLRTASWRALLPGFQGWSVEDDLIEAVMARGAARPPLERRHHEELGREGHGVALPLSDALLLIDQLTLRQQAERLEGAEQLQMERAVGPAGPLDRAVLPVACVRSIRGLGLDEESAPGVLLERVEARLIARGATAVELSWDEARQALLLSAPLARRLIAPALRGDAAGRISLTQPSYDPRTPLYSADNGVMLLQAAELSYRDADTIRAYTSAWGFLDADGAPTSRFFEDAAVGAQAFGAFCHDQNAILVAFRGTDEPVDLIADTLIDYEPGDIYGGGRVLHGFHRQLVALLPALDHWLRGLLSAAGDTEPPAIMLTGHSMGGTLAALFGAWLLERDLPLRQLYTAGQPRPGDTGFAELFGARLAGRSIPYYRYIYGFDAFPFTPPHYADVGDEVYIDRQGRVWSPARAREARAGLGVVNRVWVNMADKFADHLNSTYLGLLRKGSHFHDS